MSSNDLIAALKTAAKLRGWRYRELAAALGMSESGFKKMLAGGDIGLSRLIDICGVLQIKLADLIDSLDTQPGELVLTAEQEAAFIQSPATFGVFRVLLDLALDVPATEARLGLDRPSMRMYLGDLSRVGLVELLPDDRIKLTTPGPWSLKMGPALSRAVIANLQHALVDHAHARRAEQGAEAEQGFGQYRLSAKSLQAFQAEMRTFLEALGRQARLDALTHPANALIEVGAMAVVAPFAGADAVEVPRRATQP